jgi:hypothetical protein
MRLGRGPLIAVALLSLTIPLTAQSDNPKPPRKGDALVIKGCLRGSAVEGAETLRLDAEGIPRREEDVPILTYRLQGKKDLLRSLKDKHDRMMVEVRGILRSELSGSGLGRDVGRTRITIGIDPRSGRSPYGSDQAVPVLDVTSFEGSTVSCGR